MMEEREMDWYDLYWNRKRLDLQVDGLIHQTPEYLASFAKQLEMQVASFWKFKARNVLRLM